MTSHRKYVIQLIEAGHIPPQETSTALRLAGVTPDGSSWLKFIDQLLIWLGSLAITFSVMFFTAYNWQAIGRITKFSITEALLVMAVFAYWRLGPDTIAGKASLMTAAILLGILLALFGQTYQTGADPWQLFFTWSLLLLPWAIAGRIAALWIFLLLLLNITAMLYHHTFQGAFRLLLNGASNFYWWTFGLNTLALIIWEYASERSSYLRPRWAARLIALWSIVPLTWLTVLAIVDDQNQSIQKNLVWCLWPLWLAATYIYYRRRKPDLFVLALGCFSCLIIADVLVARYFLNYNSAADFLYIAAITIGIGTGSAIWLRNVHQEWQNER